MIVVINIFVICIQIQNLFDVFKFLTMMISAYYYKYNFYQYILLILWFIFY